MRFILSITMMTALAFGLACQSAESSSTETKNEKTADVAKTETAAKKDMSEAKTDTHTNDDGHENNDDKAPRISLEDAKAAYDKGDVIIVDTRSEVAFKTERIKGSINVPAGEFEKYYKSVPKDKKIIAYCS